MSSPNPSATPVASDALGALKWYVKRLSVMEPAEVLHRVQEQCALTALQMRYVVGRRPRRYESGAFAFCAGADAQLPNLPWSFNPDGETLASLLNGRGRALGYLWHWRRDPAVWHMAPDTGRFWPRAFFAAISYRAGNPYGDVRIAWEPSRLQHLVLLGLAARMLDGGRGNEAAMLLKEQLGSWAAANPDQQGIHYLSAMECALRILALCYATDLSRATLRRLGEAEPVWQALLGVVETHARFIMRRLSRHSSRGNHTVAEGAGLVYAGWLFPELDDAERWSATGMELLDAEANHLIAEDGGGAEQAFGYLQFVVELYGLVIALAAKQRRSVSGAVLDAYARGSAFLRACAAGADAPPPVGDSDSGHALSSALRLPIASAEDTAAMPSAHALTARTFHTSGYTVLRDADRRLSALFDHGSLGLPPLFGHGHADALSLVVRLGAEELLIDPGTYTYAGDPRWRAYFRGTRAHNTVTIDGLDQAVQETAFMWSHPYRAVLIDREELPNGGVLLLARHNGYARLGSLVEHWRAVIALPDGPWLIWDYVSGEGAHALDLHWHCGPAPLLEGHKIRLSGAAAPAAMSIDGGEVTLHRGETDPICGWRSDVYGRKEPITTVRARFVGRLPHEFTTRIAIGRRPADAAIETELEDALRRARRWVRETASY